MGKIIGKLRAAYADRRMHRKAPEDVPIGMETWVSPMPAGSFDPKKKTREGKRVIPR